MTVSTLCERDERSFIFVSAVARFALPCTAPLLCCVRSGLAPLRAGAQPPMDAPSVPDEQAAPCVCIARR